MDKNNHYSYDNTMDYDNTIDDNIVSNDKKSFAQRLGEANIMPDGMLSAIDDTERVILAMSEEANNEELDK